MWCLQLTMRAAATAAAREAGFEVIDIFGPADVVHDLSYDGGHYKAPVERELIRTLLHPLC